jgi:parvulin-like peptidyl-prolyl isomerase
MMTPGLAGLLLVPVLAAAGPPPKLEPDVICVVNDEPIRIKDLDRALFLDDHALYARDVRPFLIRGLVVRQKMSEKGISIREGEVDRYIKDLDGMLRQQYKTTLNTHLKAKGMSEEFFRRYVHRVVGLYRLVGGKGRASRHLSDRQISARMDVLLAQLVAKAKVVTDLRKLPADAAATVNGEKISIAAAGGVARIALSDEVKKKRLGKLQKCWIVRQELRRRKIEFTKDDIEFQLKLAASAKTTRIGELDVPLEKILEKMGRDVELLKRQYEFRGMAMLTRMVKGQVTEKELKATFAAGPARFGDGVPKASHIMVRTVDKQGRRLSRRDLAKAKDLAEKTYKRLMKGEDFAKVAGEVSQDRRTANLGGNLGFLDPARIDKDPVVRRAYALKVGEISRPFYGRIGWHIVKVTEINRVSYEQAKPLVMRTAVSKRRMDLLRELISKAVVRKGPAKY